MSLNNYNFHVENFEEVYVGIYDLLKRNHEETGVYDLPFDPDFDRYVRIERSGGLMFMTVRKESQVVGCSIYFIDEEIFQRGIVSATQSLVYIDKEHRGIGYKFIKFCDDILKERGVNSVWRQASCKFDISSIYKRMGYEFVETSFRRRF